MSKNSTQPCTASEHAEDFGTGTLGSAPSIESILSIDNVAETFGISRWLLRYCEFRGLIQRGNRIGAAWVYSWADCDRIAFIIKCRRAGIPLSEITAVLRSAEAESARMHEDGQELCLALTQRLEARRKAIDDALSELGHVHELLGAKFCGNAGPGPR